MNNASDATHTTLNKQKCHFEVFKAFQMFAWDKLNVMYHLKDYEKVYLINFVFEKKTSKIVPS